MVSTTTKIGEDEATHAEALAANTNSTPHTVQGDAILQLTQGSAATVVTVQRHPATENNLRTPPAENSPDWVTITAPTVDAAVGAVVRFDEPGVAWYRYRASLACQSFLSAREQ